jgi:outer membrane protein
MKKLLLGLALAGSLASADFIGTSVGAGMWHQNIGGYAKNGKDINYMNNKAAETDGNIHTGNLGLSDETKPYVWAQIIHPIPVVPNVKLQFTQYDTSGSGIAVGSVKLFGADINLHDRVHTHITIDSYDATFFYELKMFAEVEVGFGVNVLDGNTKVSTSTSSASASWIAPIPYLYARVETPTIMGFSVEAQAKYLSINSAYYHDYQGAVKYHLPTPIVDMSASLGYRSQDIFAKDGGDETKLEFQGAFAELGVRW